MTTDGVMGSVSFSIRKEESDVLDEFARRYNVSRSAVGRGLVRYALAHTADFEKWLDGQGYTTPIPNALHK